VRFYPSVTSRNQGRAGWGAALLGRHHEQVNLLNICSTRVSKYKHQEQLEERDRQQSRHGQREQLLHRFSTRNTQHFLLPEFPACAVWCATVSGACWAGIHASLSLSRPIDSTSSPRFSLMFPVWSLPPAPLCSALCPCRALEHGENSNGGSINPHQGMLWRCQACQKVYYGHMQQRERESRQCCLLLRL